MVKKLVIDPGHGGHDPGGVGNGLREKDLVLKIGKYMRDYIQDNYKGIQIKMTRSTDKFVTLSGRAKIANDWGADAFVSIHTNAGSSSAKGYEDFIFNGPVSSNTRQLQNAMHGELSPLFNTNRGKKRANFAVLRLTRASAILTESGFVTNKQDADFLKKESNLKKLGEAHAKGVAVFLGLAKGSSTSSKSKSSSKGTINTSQRIQWVGTKNKGKRLEAIAPSVNFYDTQRWTNPTGSFKKGEGWIIDNLYRVNGSLQYRVQNSNGDLYYTTARKDLVKVVDGSSSSTSTSSKSSSRSLPNTRYWVKNPPSARFNGSGVRAVQEALASVHYYPNKGAKNNGIDGWYGPDTANAVGRFQLMHGLKSDEIYGPATRKKLMEVSPLY